MTRPVGTLVMLLTLLVGPWAPQLMAQDSPASLEAVEELTRLGRTEEARGLLVRWWDEARPGASRRDRQRAFWIRGRLTVDPSQAALDFQRLAVEFPGGDFSDRALLRLAQAAWTAGDEARLDVYLDQLRRDYPGSPVVRDAQRWRAAAGPLPEPLVQTAAETSEDEVPPEEESAEVQAVPAPSVAAEPAPAYSVQLGAFAGEGRARALGDRMRGAGYDVRLVRVGEGRLLHVRVGRFQTETAAREVLDEIRGLGLDATLVEDVAREREP